MRLACLACVPLLGACFEGESVSVDAPIGTDSFQDEDPPMGDCLATGCPEPGATPGHAEIGEPCDDTRQCASGVCAAPFADGDPGALVCQRTCIPNGDQAQWCSDDESCCDSAAICTGRGYCTVLDGHDESGTSDGSGGSAASSDAGTDGFGSSGSGTR